MIDRGARDLLVRHIEDYLEERTSAFDFDEAIQSIETPDETVQAIVAELWNHYDDCTDHLIVANKVLWDLLQRLVLILKSDCTMRVSQWREWTTAQRCAALAILLLAGLYWFHPSLMLIAALATPISLILSKWDKPPRFVLSAQELAVLPFESGAQIREVYRSTMFRKRRYPAHLGPRRIRSASAEMFNTVLRYLFWVPTAPLILASLAIPGSQMKAEVRMHSDG